MQGMYASPGLMVDLCGLVNGGRLKPSRQPICLRFFGLGLVFGCLLSFVVFPLPVHVMAQGSDYAWASLKPALESSAQGMQSLEMTWRVAYTADRPVDQLLSVLQLPPHETSILEPAQFEYRVHENCVYLFRQDWSTRLLPGGGPGKLFERRLVLCTDGTSFFNMDPDNRSFIINSIENLKDSAPRVRYFDNRFVFFSGFKVPATVEELGRPITSLVLHFAGLSRAEPTVEITDTTVVQVFVRVDDGQYRFWLDSGANYSLTRLEQFDLNNRKLIEATTSKESTIVNGNDSEWRLPQVLRIRYYRWPGSKIVHESPLITETMTLTSASECLRPASAFAVEYGRAGDVVTDRRFKGEAIAFRVPADEMMLTKALDKAESDVMAGASGMPKWRVIAAAAFASITLICLVIWRRSRLLRTKTRA